MNKVATLLLGMAVAFGSHAAPASKESIEKLMQVTGAGNLGQQMLAQMLPAMQQMIPDAPPEFWQSVQQEINIDEMVAMVVPIYQKHLSEEDIQSMLAFFASPAGKKLISVQPVIMQESMQKGQLWGQQVFMRVKQKYDAMAPAGKAVN